MTAAPSWHRNSVILVSEENSGKNLETQKTAETCKLVEIANFANYSTKYGIAILEQHIAIKFLKIFARFVEIMSKILRDKKHNKIKRKINTRYI